MKISRTAALKFVSILDLWNLPENKIKDILYADYLTEDGESLEYKSYFDEEVQEFLIEYIAIYINKGISNIYLKNIITNLTEQSVEVIGLEEKLETCPCCGFLTLDNRGEYDICRLCSWEDDGYRENDINSFSHANRSTLKDAREYFFSKQSHIEDKFLKSKT